MDKVYYLVFAKDKDWAGVEGINEDLSSSTNKE